MIHHGGAVIYAKELKRVATFYEHVAGMRVCRDTIDHVMLESGAFQLVVLRIPPRIAKKISITTPPARRENTPIKPVFFVESIAQARRVAAQCGGILNDARREWDFDGVTVCDGCDPEGNVFQVRHEAKKTKG